MSYNTHHLERKKSNQEASGKMTTTIMFTTHRLTVAMLNSEESSDGLQ